MRRVDQPTKCLAKKLCNVTIGPLQPHLCCLPSIVSEFLTHAADFGLLGEAEVEQLMAAMPDHTEQAVSSMVRARVVLK
jgi:hypothetical protein